jgi:hypothetical protein
VFVVLLLGLGGDLSFQGLQLLYEPRVPYHATTIIVLHWLDL